MRLLPARLPTPHTTPTLLTWPKPMPSFVTASSAPETTMSLSAAAPRSHRTFSSPTAPSALPELLITNITMNKVNLTGSKTFGIYYATAIKLIDSSIAVPSGVNSISIFDSQILFTNSTPSSAVVTLDGASTNSLGNNLSFFNTLAALKSTNALDVAPVLSLATSTFTVSNHLDLDAT